MAALKGWVEATVAIDANVTKIDSMTNNAITAAISCDFDTILAFVFPEGLEEICEH